MSEQGPVLKTERVTLRLPKISHAQGILNFYIENKEFLTPYDPLTPDGFYTIEYWKDTIHRYWNAWLERRELRFIIQLNDQNETIGMVNFSQMERGPFQCCRLGYKLGEKYNGQGLMTEALNVAIKYVFEELNFHRIEANYIPSNEKSGEVLKRCNFKIEGLAENYLKINGLWQDHVLTSLTNVNWSD